MKRGFLHLGCSSSDFVVRRALSRLGSLDASINGASTRHRLANLGTRGLFTLKTRSEDLKLMIFYYQGCTWWASGLNKQVLCPNWLPRGRIQVMPLKIRLLTVPYPEIKHARCMLKIGGANTLPLGAVERCAWEALNYHCTACGKWFAGCLSPTNNWHSLAFATLILLLLQSSCQLLVELLQLPVTLGFWSDDEPTVTRHIRSLSRYHCQRHRLRSTPSSSSSFPFSLTIL